MTREIAHQKSFEKALHSIQPNFPQGKLPGAPEYTSVYYNMSQGEEAPRGPWNEGPDWEYVESPEPAVDGGDGLATVNVSKKDAKVLKAMTSRTASDTGSDPTTGADLGAGAAIVFPRTADLGWRPRLRGRRENRRKAMTSRPVAADDRPGSDAGSRRQRTK